MFNKILVAVDRSEMSIKVFEQALSLAKITSANLMLLHVLSQEEEGSPEALVFPNIDYYPGWNEQSFKLYQEHWEKFKNEGLQMLQSWSAQANTSGVNTEFTQNTGSPGRMICELATDWNADLIIMGRRGRSGLAEFFLGSVSNYVLHHAPCSVQIVHVPINSPAVNVSSAATAVSN
ncbi:universal stress protein [Aphanizomenon sp. CS-733/32]|jgi:nucleotide-binding universal stress UspA family protein|uniref:universal stress protein n=1 Tax=Aphanizomenon sp. CS-733/32 TaxID=3021715 RepID=UPI002330B44F|nr:universal stress protein [Aphanizomenon sp. CS-733/32]MDB9307650.1 universal stress protein [Aphanizomenon sp. CS-733/32]MDM3844690.1 universal stress protein [Aphanizomenon gracile PMC638.10]MDM3862296.1 universal stress protein [Aphanizomenon gracile PMC644.10]